MAVQMSAPSLLEGCVITIRAALIISGLVPAFLVLGELIEQRVPDEQRLYDSIMNNYQRSIMPRVNHTHPLAVAFSLRLNQIINLDERKQVLTTNVFIDQTWIDVGLAWDPSKFSDVRALRIPAEHVWLPDTFVYNNADNGASGFMHGTYVQIQKNGRVLWPVPLRVRSSCSVHITYFPFDSQICKLKFGSWIYGLKHLDYTPLQDGLTVDPSTYVNNSEWELVSITISKSMTHTGGPAGFSRTSLHPQMTYVLHLRRNTFFYLFNIIVPCAMLSTLNVLTFWLPPVSGEKVTLGLSVFLAFSMFMLLIAEEVPATSEAVPLIGVYLCMVMTMTSLSVIMAVVVTNLYHRGRKMRSAPRWMVKLCLQWLAGPLCVSNEIPRIAKTVDVAENCQYDLSYRKKSTAPVSNNILTAATDTTFATNFSPNQPSCLGRLRNSFQWLFSSSNGRSRVRHTLNRQSVSTTTPRRSASTPFHFRTGDERKIPPKEVHPSLRNNVSISAPFKSATSASQRDETIKSENNDLWVLRDLDSRRSFNSTSGVDVHEEEDSDESESSRSLFSDQQEYRVSSSTPFASFDPTAGTRSPRTSSSSSTRVPNSATAERMDMSRGISESDEDMSKLDPHPSSAELRAMQRLIAEWQQIATVVDRVMFFFYLLSTVTAYVVILAVLPAQQPPVVNSTFDHNGDLHWFHRER